MRSSSADILMLRLAVNSRQGVSWRDLSEAEEEGREFEEAARECDRSDSEVRLVKWRKGNHWTGCNNALNAGWRRGKCLKAAGRANSAVGKLTSLHSATQDTAYLWLGIKSKEEFSISRSGQTLAIWSTSMQCLAPKFITCPSVRRLGSLKVFLMNVYLRD